MSSCLSIKQISNAEKPAGQTLGRSPSFISTVAGREERGGLARRTINACGNLRVSRKSVRAVSNRPYIFCVFCGQEFLELLSSTELLGRRKRGIVIGLIGDAAHILYMSDLIIWSDDEHRAGENAI